MVTVTIQNKDVPVCIAPGARTTVCTDIEKKVADPVGYGFGTASAYSNCGYVLAEIAPTTNFEACYPTGKNFFTRTWQVKNCNNVVVSSCTQVITVTRTSDFTVDFPDDVVVGCVGNIPSKDALKAQMLDPASWGVTTINPATGKARGDGAILNRGCGVIAIEIKDDTLMATNDLECMKILRKIKVIDWCKYNPNNDAVDQDTNCYGDPVCGDIHAPIPPGASNPLGTRWIGTSAPAIGFHATPQEWSVGTAASHGCMRMKRVDVERLYELVRVGMPVDIEA